ncbi:class I SAM-dependent methyltransferase [Leucobacter sp. USHLN153]|uniref:class I SAM-dependent methyltransferase n=1 Tax=Leucobacter sp. USHLN153 TaxID=3081268 RepID=UPI003016EE92
MTRPDTATKHASDVSAMFDEVSPRYDLINDVLTVGNDRLWRVATTKAVAPRPGMRILDLAAGTGTSSAALAAHGAHVVAADFSEGMLAEGRKRHAGNKLIEFQWADATQLPFEDDSFDAATISYGLRNVNDPKAALAEMRRVVKPGGRVVIAEFSTPPSGFVRGPYAFYGRHVLPRVAGAINREAAQAYRYLNESIEAWPNQTELAAWMREAGLERVAYRNLTFGIVALHRGFVPREAPKPVTAEPAKPAAVKKPAAAKKPASAGSAAVSKPSGEKPAASKTSATKSAAVKQPEAGMKPAAATKPAAAKDPAAPKKPVSPKPAAAKDPAAPKKPVSPKPAAAKPAASKPAAKPAASMPAAPKPAAPKPAAPKPASPKPDAPKSNAPKPAAPKPAVPNGDAQ